MYGTTIQGSFTSSGVDQEIYLQPGVSWIEVYNLTNINTAATDKLAYKFLWTTSIDFGGKIVWYKSDAAHADNLITSINTNGFYPFDSTVTTPGTLHNDITGVSNAAIPVVTTNAAHGLQTGDTVRLYDITGAQQIGGTDFTVTVLTPLTFRLDYMPQIAAGTVGSFRRVNPTSYWYPRMRYITKVTNAANAQITMSVLSNFEVGQKIKVAIPSIFGMTLAPTACTVTAYDAATNTLTTDLDTTALDPFVYPTTLQVAGGFTQAQVVPFGENTALARTTLSPELYDATRNEGKIGIRLAAGVDCPAGELGDEIFFKAGNYLENE